LRLRKSDIEGLDKQGYVQEKVSFPSQNYFGFRLESKKTDWSIAWEATTLNINIPKQLCEKWIESEEVSLRKEFPLSNDETLILLIEKDFPCKHTGADFEDTFYELQPEEFKMKKQ
jgi:hypothetical protein